jgi:8-oxo-dGTP pyrophosphatase MutT (NUDIX family)
MMQPQYDPTETEALIARYGPTVQREFQLSLDEQGYAYWWQVKALVRRAEVVMVVQRPDGQMLLHTKEHYPPATYRFPSGGIGWGEMVLDALAREQWEEMSLRLPPASMPALIRYNMHHAEHTILYDSYVFVLRADDTPRPIPQDPDEAISDLCWIEPARLPVVSDHLRNVIRAWGEWGKFRAIAHDVIFEVMNS